MVKKAILIAAVFILILSGATAVQASTITTHTAVAYLIGANCDGAPESFFYSFLSHALLDYVDPEYNVDLRYQSAVEHNLDFVCLEVGCSLLIIRKIFKEPDPARRKILLWAYFGALLPDIIEGINYSINENPKPIFTWNRDLSPCRKQETMALSVSLTLLTWRY